MIPQNFADAFESVKKLVDIFRQNEAAYISPGYNEADARKDFIDKFWIALGWDVNHEAQTNPYQQEVKVERGVATSEWRKRADYAFLAPNFRDVRFFVEAKKPHAGLDNPLFYFQTIRYGWNSHVPISVLTDFEELRVLDCRYKPEITTAPGRAVLKYHYTDYADEAKFRTIYYLFSREAVLKGSLEEYAKGLPKLSRRRAPRGVVRDEHQNIDEAFLKELDQYREELARAFKRKNPELGSEELTEITQRTLDRLVFMRFLEDKLIESEPLIENLHQTGKTWRNFINSSRRLDRIYNGIIFKEHALLDSPDFKVDERTFDKISRSLSHKESPYDFNAIPIHILGSIYERFLGKVIVATAKQARVEEKPEVRKAGGVYYTPEYIVRYIVDNTVGKLIEGKTPEEIRQLKFADIACGSGSFLLGVYDKLLRYHTAYYNRTKKNQNEGRRAGCLTTDTGALRLSLLQKRDILLNNLHGVDIDPQAVEVAQLSLYLKLLEDETIASAHAQQLSLKAALLPSLSKNIVSGNSLIGWDILEGKLFDSGDERKLNPMNFEDAFPEIMKRGGFDAIVGNPPYGAQFGEVEKNYIRKTFESYRYKYDSYIYFIEKALRLVRKAGYVGMITPELWLKLESAAPLRELVFRSAAFQKLLICGENVFDQAVVNTIVSIFYIGDESISIQIEKGSAVWSIQSDTWQSSATYEIDYRLRPEIHSLAKKIRLDVNKPLSAFGEAIQGITPYDRYQGQDPKLIKARAYHFNYRRDDTCEKWLAGTDVSRYELGWSGEWLSYGPWLGAARDPRFFKGPRLLFREIPGEQKRIQATLTTETFYHGHSITPFKVSPGISLEIRYLLALVNSKLISWYGGLTLPNFGKDIFPKLNPQDIKALRIRALNLNEPEDKRHHDRAVQLVDQMIGAKKQLAAARTERDKNFYENKCATLDRQIDNLVYELYNLTPEEIALVEGSGK